ncbi:CMGC family protein kinase [Tritrichomonas foetus]|uniref:non-specific serine/threonine protein kinase n=1 Tax=Tritrichomonas foetus TaxID=1144522 RepID=A0A1J4K8X8_9EUKA|nr:CMGC family protein kinase [Tritrichomonas foetus]|eukprot:OHT06172.1 CMGC family protein kinase [Tritrichomonas foetus]
MATKASYRTDKSRLSSMRLHSSLALSTSQRKGSSRLSQATKKAQNAEYKPVKVVGQGAFGVVYCARASDGSLVAIKKVLLDPRYKNRELETMQEVHNRYVIGLRSSFKTAGRKPKEVYLNLVMDFLPMSLHQFNMNYRKERKYPPLLYVKLFAFQMFAGLNYLHSIGITHRDLKPQNMLVDPDSGELKVCDLGSAKKLSPNEQSVSYIASRYYRAPELIFDCVYYSTSIDIWAAGCCLAEMIMAGMPIFAGGSSIGQLHEILKVLGLPTEDDMNSFQHGADIELPEVIVTPLEQILPRHTPPDLMDLMKRIFIYNPTERPTAYECMQHPCFDELFETDLEMPSKRPFPVLERE